MVQVKRSGTANSTPSALAFGELALNYADGKVFWKNASNTISSFTFQAYATAASPAITGNVTIDTSSGVPLTITNTGTGASFRVNDEASDTTPFIVDASGNVGIGTASPAAKLDVAGDMISRSYIMQNFGTTSSIVVRRADGTSTSPTATASGVVVGEIIPQGYDGSTYRTSGLMQWLTAETVSSTAAGAHFRLFTIPTGSTSLAERLRIEAGGNVGIGTSSPSALLDVNSNTLRLRTARTPASATAAGNAGDICWDASYLYICTATGTWRRIAHSTW